MDGKLDQSIEGSWFIHKVGLPYSTFYVKEYAGVDPQTGKALYYMNTQDANGNYDKQLLLTLLQHRQFLISLWIRKFQEVLPIS